MSRGAAGNREGAAAAPLAFVLGPEQASEGRTRRLEAGWQGVVADREGEGASGSEQAVDFAEGPVLALLVGVGEGAEAFVENGRQRARRSLRRCLGRAGLASSGETVISAAPSAAAMISGAPPLRFGLSS